MDPQSLPFAQTRDIIPFPISFYIIFDTKQPPEWRNIVFCLLLEMSRRDDWSESVQLTSNLSEYLRVATFCELDVTVSILETLRIRLWEAVKQFDILVPDSVYLPAPPLYCPQPVIVADEVRPIVHVIIH